LGERRVVEKVNGGHSSTDSKKTNPDRRAIHIHYITIYIVLQNSVVDFYYSMLLG
jgi:hypothetical protein